MTTKIFAILVTYNPDLNLLEKNILSVINQVDKIYIIDNGSRKGFLKLPQGEEKIEIKKLKENIGVAAAFNIGIRLAKENFCDYVVLLDQDSCLPFGAMSLFKNIIQNTNENNKFKIASIGPQLRDSRSGRLSGFITFKWFYNTRVFNCKHQNLISTDFLISSGSFYPISIFDEIGMFREDLFIDHVDTEWCLRAVSHGFKLFGVSGVVMDHSLGEGDLNFRVFRRFNHPTHKPFRLYYVVRNSLKLYRLPHVSVKWISGDIFRLLRIFLLYAIFSPLRKQAISWYFLGVCDGLRNAGGPAPKPSLQNEKN